MRLSIDGEGNGDKSQQELALELQRELEGAQLQGGEMEFGGLPEGARGLPPLLGIDLSWLTPDSVSKFLGALGSFLNRNPQVTLRAKSGDKEIELSGSIDDDTRAAFIRWMESH